jgi:hypothetical protein
MPRGCAPLEQACPWPTQVFCTQQPPPLHRVPLAQQGSPGPPHLLHVVPAQIKPSPHFEGRQHGSPAPPHLLHVAPEQRRSAP